MTSDEYKLPPIERPMSRQEIERYVIEHLEAAMARASEGLIFEISYITQGISNKIETWMRECVWYQTQLAARKDGGMGDPKGVNETKEGPRDAAEREEERKQRFDKAFNEFLWALAQDIASQRRPDPDGSR